MANFFETLFNKKPTNVESKSEVVVAPKYDFVKQYVLADPRNIMIDYSLWSSCPTVPVAHESDEKGTGFCKCVELPTKVFLGYLAALKKAPAEIRKNPKMRTISVIKLDEDKRMYVIPDLKDAEKPFLLIYLKKENKVIQASSYCNVILKYLEQLKKVKPDTAKDPNGKNISVMEFAFILNETCMF